MLKKQIACLVVFAMASTASLVVAADAADPYLPAESLNPTLAAPIDTWDEAIPLGNGVLGGLLWGKDSTVRLSLDRGDLWDTRVSDEFNRPDFTWKTMQRLVAEKNQAELLRRWEEPFFVAWPTKLPGGRLELVLDPSQRVASFTLDLAHAVGRADLGSGTPLEAFFSAVVPVAMVRIPGAPPKAWNLIAPTVVKKLGYPEAESGQDGDTKWFAQEAVAGFRYAVVASTRRDGDSTQLALTITSSNDSPDPVDLGRRRTAEAIAGVYSDRLAAHEAWWREFWQKSRVELPDLKHLRHYYLSQYFYGAASRPGSPPMPLQGVWTADDGGLPPWKGEYANNLNTQMIYAAYQTAGRFDEGRVLLDFMSKLLPEFRTFAETFYGVPGAAVPTAMSLQGKPLGGYPPVAVQPTNGAWIGYLFYQHWRYTMDEAFLREQAYPWCAEIGQCLRSLLKPDADGLLRLPLSSSPEIHDDALTAWLKPNSNFDHDCMAALFAALGEMAEALGKGEEAAQWRAVVTDLGPRAVDPQTNGLMLAPGENLLESHRHLSHTMSIHPFGLMTIEGSDRDRAIIAASCRHYDELGTSMWVGFTFPWMACLRARTGDAEAAIHHLDIYEKAFILRNGFHANGDQLKAGYSSHTYRPFTLEGNFLASQAVHEMLLQSWGGVIRVFPATPSRWHEAAFDDLRAEGGYRVCARRENDATVWLKVTAGRDGVVRIRDPFSGRQPAWNRPEVKKTGQDWQCQLGAGDILEARLP
jgi:alpha-L-fucosidase 2